jgi:hypothetical protein
MLLRVGNQNIVLCEIASLDCMELNPFPTLAVPLDTVPAPNTNSFAKVGVARPLSRLLLVPVAAEVISSGEF